MAKLIVRFMAIVLEISAILLVIGGGLMGLESSIEEAIENDTLDAGLAFFMATFLVPIGVLGGFIVATIILGIPLLILRINQNLEEINESLKK